LQKNFIAYLAVYRGMNEMLKASLSATLMLGLICGTVNATLFDFEGAPYLGGPAAIESYMEGVYGSDITVSNGIVGNGIIPGPLGPDHYIQAGPSWGMHSIDISFNVVPITSVSFDWGVEVDAFHAYADGVEFFTEGWSLWASGHSAPIIFASPVTTLRFTNSNLGEIEVDNLHVTPVPEPSTLLLLGIGLAGLASYGKLRFRRKKRT
jgi:hypothetical protein